LDYLDSSLRKEVDAFVVGSLGWYMRQNFTMIYRGTIVGHSDWAEHGLGYFIPALLWAMR